MSYATRSTALLLKSLLRLGWNNARLPAGGGTWIATHEELARLEEFAAASSICRVPFRVISNAT